MNIKRITTISVIFIIILIISELDLTSYKNTDTLINKIACRVYEFNSFELVVDQELDINDFEVRKGANIIFALGEQKDRIGQEYGYCLFKIFYKGLVISEFGHFKSNNWYSNDYKVMISKKHEQFNLSYDIKGPSAGNDSFQKRYVRDAQNQLIRIDFMNSNGEIYHSEPFSKK